LILQDSKRAKVKDVGPVPEGKYWVLLYPDPDRVANFDKISGELLPIQRAVLKKYQRAHDLLMDALQLTKPGVAGEHDCSRID